MANAKFREDISERLIENTSERYEALVADFFSQFPEKQFLSGEAYLTRSGRRMEDVEICEPGQELDLAIVLPVGAFEPEIELQDEAKQRMLKPQPDGRLKLSFKKSGSHRLQIACGGFFRIYTIHAVEPFVVDEMPAFAKLIQSLAENPPHWTEATFSEFRIRLEEALSKSNSPAMFTEGIIEYHLGLFHEQQGIASFRDRFQFAFGCLRWFAPYSDIANLICIYFLFCANEFEAAEKICKDRKGRLRNAISFYLRARSSESVAANSNASEQGGLPLLLAPPDVLAFQAIEALDDDRNEDALQLVSIAKTHIRPNFHKERYARLSLLEAYTKESLGDTKGSQTIFQILESSSWQPIASIAATHLKKSHNG